VFVNRKSPRRSAVKQESVKKWQPGFLIVLRLFYWGTARILRTQKQRRDVRNLMDRICAGIETVTPEMLSRVWEVAEYRIDIRRATNGALI